MKLKYLLWAMILCLLILGIVALQHSPLKQEVTLTENDSLPTRRQLRQSFFEKREVLVAYGAKDKQIAKKYKSLLDSLSKTPQGESRRSISFQYKEASQLNDADIKENILLLVGTPESNPVLERLARHTPFQINRKQINFNKKQYSSDATILSISFYPNTENDTLPVSFLTGIEESRIYDFFENRIRNRGRSFFRQNMDYEIYNENKRIVMGDFGLDWKLDSTTLFDFSKGNELLYSTEYYDFISHQNSIKKKAVLPLATEMEQTRKTILDFSGKDIELPRFTYHIYKSAEEKGLMTGSTAQANYNYTDNTVHTIINEKYLDNFIEKENALLLYHLLDSANTKALERGLPVYFTDRWQREGYRYWSAALQASGNALTLNELFDNATVEMESPLIIDCLSASLIAFLLETWGKETFLKRYSNWIPTLRDIGNLEPKWQQYLARNSNTIHLKEKEDTPLPYLKGFNFAHEGYSIYNGYGSKKATQALKKQKELGSNAMAIVPYSFIRDKNLPAPFYIGSGAGSENDEGLVHSTFEAKKMGMFTLMKPQIWAGDSWPGEIEMLNDEDWKKFFDYYYRWIRHFAFLAEIHDMDALCLGVEFTKATLMHGDEWRKMIRKIRGLYQGKLTYAANWGAEFENISFWDDLDFVGLNCYYPLSKEDNPTDAELKANFEKVKVKIEKVYDTFQKPIVFTEIGFRSTNMPWKSPHAEGDDSFNEAHQQRCYEIIFEGIENEPWCQGILWWKFPSFLEYQGKENSAFTPNNKMAEKTVKRWFSK